MFWCVFLLSRAMTTHANDDAREIVLNPTTARQPFISSLTYGYDLKTVCADISQGAVWEPGNLAVELNRHILTHTEMRIDGYYVNFIRPVFTRATLSNAFDASGQRVAGTYGGEMVFCVDVDSLPAGQYTFAIRIWSTSGMEHSYRWDVFIRDRNPSFSNQTRA
jgi:hypothetical protein